MVFRRFWDSTRGGVRKRPFDKVEARPVSELAVFLYLSIDLLKIEAAESDNTVEHRPCRDDGA